MKTTTLLLSASVLANVALVAFLAFRPAPPAGVPGSVAASAAATGSTSARPPTRDDALRTALVSGNAAALEAAGLAPGLSRDIVLGRTLSQIATKLRAARTEQATDRWWRQSRPGAGTREQQLLTRRELSDALVAALGEDPGFFAAGDSGQFAFLPPAKREALRRILQDYEEMTARYSAGGVQLASDRERLALLRAERERDIAALLTPEERLAYDMRMSPTAATVRARYGDGIETEEDFRKIFALQRAFDERFPPESFSGRVTPEQMRARSDAQRQLQDDIRAALGEPAYAALRRATDPDLRTIDSLVTRLNLAPGTTDRIAAARETFAAESQRIAADTAVPAAQRRAQVQEIGTRARAEVQRALGAEAAEAYAQRSAWLQFLQGGIAFSTTPPPGSPAAALAGAGNLSVFPIPPAGAPAAGATRQMISTVTTDVPAGHGEFLFGTPEGGVREAARVMTFSIATSDTATAATAPSGDAAGAPAQRTMVVQPQPAPPPPPPPRP